MWVLCVCVCVCVCGVCVCVCVWMCPSIRSFRPSVPPSGPSVRPSVRSFRKSRISCKSWLFGKSAISRKSRISGTSRISGISGNSRISGTSRLSVRGSGDPPRPVIYGIWGMSIKTSSTWAESPPEVPDIFNFITLPNAGASQNPPGTIRGRWKNYPAPIIVLDSGPVNCPGFRSL